MNNYNFEYLKNIQNIQKKVNHTVQSLEFKWGKGMKENQECSNETTQQKA